MTNKFTDARIVLLRSGLLRSNRCIVAPTGKGASAKKSVEKMIDAGWLKEIKTKSGAPVWRTDEETGIAYSLKLTAAGLKFAAANETQASGAEAIARTTRPAPTPLPRKPLRPADRTEPSAATNLQAADDTETARSRIGRVTLFAQSIDIEVPASDVRPAERISIPWTPKTFQRKREVIAPTSQGSGALQSIRWEARTRLVSAIAKARRWLDEIVSGKTPGIEAIAAREGLNERSARVTLSLAFLAPDIVKAAVEATLPQGFGLSRFTDLPASWAKQRRGTGLLSSA